MQSNWTLRGGRVRSLAVGANWQLEPCPLSVMQSVPQLLGLAQGSTHSASGAAPPESVALTFVAPLLPDEPESSGPLLWCARAKSGVSA